MKSDFLFRFIDNLDRGELRYIKHQLTLDESAVGRKNLALFNILSTMRIYDAKKLRKHASIDLSHKELFVAKNRLYQRLMVELKRLHAQRSPADHPRKCLDEARILYSMKMLDEAAELLIKGLAKLKEHENLLLEVALRNQLRIVYKDMARKDLSNKRTQLEYELVMASQKLATYARYAQINDRMFDYLRNHRVTSAETVKRGLQELISTPEMKAVHMADSLSSQLLYFTIWQMYYSQQNDLENSIEMNKRVIELRESDPVLLMEDANSYTTSLTNIIGKLNMLGRTTEALRYLKQLEEAPTRDRRSEIVKFSDLEINYQLYYLNKGEIGSVLLRETALMTGLRRFGKQVSINRRITLLYNLGVAHMLVGNHGKAKRHFDLIRQMGLLPVRLDLQGISRLLRLVMLCADEGRETFEHFLRNSKKFFEQGTRQYPLENVVYTWVEEHSRAVGKTAKNASYQKLENELASMVSENLLGAEEMQIWAEAQRRGITGEVVFKERLAAAKKKEAQEPPLN